MRIRSAGNGEPGVNGGPPGDLYVEIHIKPHPVFQREGDDLHCEMPISFVKATLGGEIEVPTLTGKVSPATSIARELAIALNGVVRSEGRPTTRYASANVVPAGSVMAR